MEIILLRIAKDAEIFSNVTGWPADQT